MAPNTKSFTRAYHVASQQLFPPKQCRYVARWRCESGRKSSPHSRIYCRRSQKLDLEILEKVQNTKTRFGKLLEKYGNMNLAGKILFGIGASALAGFATGGAGTFAVSGTLMAAGVNAKQRKARSWRQHVKLRCR